MSAVKLREFMQAIRAELEEAQEEMNARKKVALFELQGMELELVLVTRKSTTKEGAAELWVVSGKLEKTDDSEVTQTVRLTYKVSPVTKGISRAGDRFHSSSDPQEEQIVDVLPKITS